ncbi:MAG: hypothetical protein GTO08_03360 [Deltaproteobacteria bacterium]|nr:hypothetical protein [Deltaproteobacteria bacterium]
MVLLLDYILYVPLDHAAYYLANFQIQSPVHDPEAVGRTHHRVGSLSKEIPLRNIDLLDVGEDLLPRLDEFPILIPEINLLRQHIINPPIICPDST